MTDASFAKFQQQFEMFLNQQAAELEAVRTIVQSLLVSMFGSHPNGTDLLNDLRANALASLSQVTPGQASDQGRAKMREASKSEAEEFFEDMRGIFPGLTARTGSEH